MKDNLPKNIFRYYPLNQTTPLINTLMLDQNLYIRIIDQEIKSMRSSNSQQSIHNCHYCATQFDQTIRAPYLICNNQHQICLQCLNQLQLPTKCRVCLMPVSVNNIRLNSLLIDVLSSPRKENPYVSNTSPYQRNNNAAHDNLTRREDNKSTKVGTYSAYNEL